MKSINNKIVYEYVIEKSRFIGVLYRVNSKEEIDKYLENIRKEYKDATHYCYAYKLDSIRKSSDDGEPGGTAGVPMMEVLNSLDLDFILAIVIRYFGGIKLGAGGIVRAYRKTLVDALSNNKEYIVNLTDGYQIEIKTSYDKQKEIDNTFKYIINKEYTDIVKYIINITKEEYELYKDRYDIKVLDNIKIETK